MSWFGFGGKSPSEDKPTERPPISFDNSSHDDGFAAPQSFSTSPAYGNNLSSDEVLKDTFLFYNIRILHENNIRPILSIASKVPSVKVWSENSC